MWSAQVGVNSETWRRGTLFEFRRWLQQGTWDQSADEIVAVKTGTGESASRDNVRKWRQ